jgi:excisionase family DNA binding protein
MIITNKNERDILTTREIMNIFGVERDTVYRWHKKGILRLKKIGGKFFAKRADVEKIIQSIGEQV